MRSGKSFATCFFKAAQQQRAQFRGQTAARDALLGPGVFAARLVGFEKMFLVAEIAGLDEIHDAPQIEQPVFQRRAGERDFVFALQLLHRLRDLRAGIFDELRLVENDGAERKFLQLFQVAPEQRVIRDDDVVLRDLFPQIMPRRAAFEHEHFHFRA
jgi:hypothetical protein